MFPDKAKMARNANRVLLVLAVAPVVYMVEAALATFGKGGLARDPSIVPVLFYGLVIVSLVNIGTMVFFQTSKSFMSERGRYDPVGRTYLIMSTSAVLAEAHAIYGLVLTLLSGSIFYAIGFSLVAWACLWWVRDKFKMNLGKLPNAQSS
jgi:F0F1-type ATP synthase membrane subunit c/vacuolar-type H+-ATPase subunit K